MKITKLLENYPSLLFKWQNFSEGREYTRAGKQVNTLFIKKLSITRKDNSKEELIFNQGINYIANQDIIYIIKFMLTGKLKKEYRKAIKELLLEVLINKDHFSIYILLSNPTYGKLTDENNNEVCKASSLKELKKMLNIFFQNKLHLPYLAHTMLIEKPSYHPITFATYFNYFLIDDKDPKKIFMAKQSTLWRKKSLPIIIGLRGYPLIAFFKELLIKNTLYQNILSKELSKITKEINNTKEQRHWQKQFMKLIQKEKQLKEELGNLLYQEEKEQNYNSDKDTEINTQINETSKNLNTYKKKELLILKEIKYLGGNFHAGKKHPKLASKISNNKQYTFYISPENNKNKEKIDELIGDYYLNLSQITILEQNLDELECKKKEELMNKKEKEKQNEESIKSEIENNRQNISYILDKEHITINRYIQRKNLLKRNLKEEKELIEKIIISLETKYKEEHRRIMSSFMKVLKDKLSSYMPIKSIHISKHYIPKIISKNDIEIDFHSLIDEKKDKFIIAFYLSLLSFSIEHEGRHPGTLFINNKNYYSLLELKDELILNKAQVFIRSTD